MFKRTTSLVIVYALSMVFPLPSVAGPDPHVVPLARVDDTGVALSATGKVKIELRELRVELTGPYGKPVPHRIFILFEPQSGAFSWTVGVDDSPTDKSMLTKWFKSDRAAFLKDGCLVTFTARSVPLRLYVQNCAGHASTMDDAEEKSLSFAAELNDPPGDIDSARPSHTVPLDGLSLDFVHEPENALIGPDPKVIDVQWDGLHWIVTIKARWIEAIILDGDYNLVSMEKIE